MSNQLNEGLKAKDLVYLVGNKIHFDEYDSKMGEPEDVITVSFKVKQRMPSQDLSNFIENGYDWVLDADVSSGEIDDNEYLVFVEMPRKSKVFEQVTELLNDLAHLTDIDPSDWQFKWYKQKDYLPMNEDNLSATVPNSPSKYKDYVEQFDTIEKEKKSLTDDISKLKKLSGIE